MVGSNQVPHGGELQACCLRYLSEIPPVDFSVL